MAKKIAKSAKSSSFDFMQALPRGYNPVDAINFHGRDKEGISEQLTETGLRKAILLDEVPAVFDIGFEKSKQHAVCRISLDGEITVSIEQQAKDIVRSLLGLHIDSKHFAALVARDPVFGPLTKARKGLRIIQSSSIFEALTWAVMGQQINVSFAVALRRTFVQLAGRRHSSGLRCYPAAADAANIALEALTARQYSRSKAETILRLATAIASGELDLVVSPVNSLDDICAALLALKGIGPWTVNYALLRGFAYADCSLHGDVAVRAAITKLWGHQERLSIAAAEQFLAQYRPHRTMAAAYLWASLNVTAAY